MIHVEGISLRRSGWLLAFSMVPVPAHSQVAVEDVQRLIASDGAGGSGNPFEDPGDQFGFSVAVSGGIAVVGAQYHDSLGIPSAGAVYVFRRAGDQWVEQSKLVASDASPGGNFGVCCDVDGSTIVVGGGQGVYVFGLHDSGWLQDARLSNNDLGFGKSVAIDGDTIVVGGTEVAYVFVRASNLWILQGVLDPAGLTPSSCFGCSVAIHEDLIAVGAGWDDVLGYDSGSAYVFERQGSTWVQLAKLIPADGGPGDGFGFGAALGSELVAIGSPAADTEGVLDSGAVYVFRRDTLGWSQESKIVLNSPVNGDNLGGHVSLCGDMLTASTRASSTTYIYTSAEGSWEQLAQLTAFDDPLPFGDFFGFSAGADGDFVLVGAPRDEPLGNDSGAAYLYRIHRRAGTATCFGTACPCGNTDASAGCANSTGLGGSLVGTGSRSVSCENSLEFTASQLPHPTSGLLYMGDTAIAAPLLDGVQCAGGTTYRLTGLMQTADGAGAITFGPGVLGVSSDLIDPGETWHFQAFYRDAVGSPCGAGANLTNAYSVTFLP